ncbi:ImmA/IrrE family metallo-endopeptidase [Flexivirga meconopsidis]|uniref:ImmA/IrrE family metallo-endopeptidase n=1 Tax=Flexivirga meconopsidis TaxID=2977121 RepID=UPI00223F30F3|nr:ImmA/IrrE family metallo-endopeptidase [Flexivirga meconopsidis]
MSDRARRVHEHSRSLLRSAGVWRCRELDHICAAVEQHTGRQLVRSATHLDAATVHGAVVRTADIDYVIVESQTSPDHQQHILLHELGHLLCDHSDQAHGLLTRSTYTDPLEYEAEVIASLLGQHLRRAADPLHLQPVDPQVHRLLDSFGLLGR